MKKRVTDFIKGKKKTDPGSIAYPVSQVRYCFSDISDKNIRAVHMVGCAVMACVVNARTIELDIKKSTVKIEGSAYGWVEKEMML